MHQKEENSEFKSKLFFSQRIQVTHFHLLFTVMCLKVNVLKGRTDEDTDQDEAGVVSVPPAKGWYADFWVLVVMENLTSAVGVSTQDEAGFKPLQQLRREMHIYLRDQTGCCSLTSSVSSSPTICCFHTRLFLTADGCAAF